MSRKYTLKTYNPLLLFGIFLILFITLMITAIMSPSNADMNELISFMVLTYFLFFGFKLFGQNISVEISEQGVATNWAVLPFFKKTYKEIEWNNIESWNMSEGFRTLAYTFTIKTKDGQKLYIRCIGYRKPTNLEDFVNDFENTYSRKY